MKFLEKYIFYGYELLTVFIPFIVFYFIIDRFYNNREIKSTKRDFLFKIVFAIYIYGAFHMTGSGTLYELLRRYQDTDFKINLVPFSNSIDIVGYILNVVLFMPLGFLVPLIWDKFRNVVKIALFGIFFSLLIEVSQLYTNRATDIDDLIVNTFGALVGYLIFKVFINVTKLDLKSKESLNFEPIIYIVIMFISRYLLFNEFGLVKLLYFNE